MPRRTVSPGRGAPIIRLFASLIGFSPLVGLSFIMGELSDKLHGGERYLVYGAGLLVSSFSYDVLKTILMVEEEIARAIWRNILYVVLYIAGYLVLGAALAYIDFEAGILRDYPALVMVLLTMVFLYLATKTFVATVHIAMKR